MIDDIRQTIISEQLRQGLTCAELARRMGCAPPAVHRALRDGHDMRISMAQRFADALGCRWIMDERVDE